jgi:hypothetical protein
MTVLLAVSLAATGCHVESPAVRPGTPTTEAASEGGESPPATESVDTPAAAKPSTSENPESRPEASAKSSPEPSDQAVPITFDDLKIDMKEDTAFEPSMLTERVQQLDGQRVRIRGFLFPSVFQQTGITKFPLIKNLECKFGPGGQAHHIIIVDMKPGLSTSFTVRPITVEGILTVRPWNGPDENTWALYHMVGEKVE